MRETLALLCRAEVSHCEERRIQIGTGIAKFPHQRTPEQRMAQLAKPKLLIMDEFGYLPFEPAAAHLLFQLISRRYEKGSILITSDQAPAAVLTKSRTDGTALRLRREATAKQISNRLMVRTVF